MTNGMFEFGSGEALAKPKFFFENAIPEDDTFMMQGEHRWFRTVGGLNIFLPNKVRMRVLANL